MDPPLVPEHLELMGQDMNFEDIDDIGQYMSYEDFVDTGKKMGFEEWIDFLSKFPGTTPEFVGKVLADVAKEYSNRSKFLPPGMQEEEECEHVHVDLPKITISMTPEKQAEAVVKYRKLFVGDATAPASVPPTSSRFMLVTAQVAARREEEYALEMPLPKNQARTVSSVNGFPMHSGTTPWDKLQPILLTEMHMHKPASGRSLLCRIIAPSLCSYSVQTVVEDIEGAAYDLSIYNYPTTFDATLQDSDRLFPQDAVLLIREPVFMPSQQGSNPLVRVDSPSDIVVLAQHSAMLPEVSFATAAKTDPPCPLKDSSTDDYWRTNGNELFKQAHWFPAAVAYSRGLALKPDSLVLRLNRAEAYIRLGFFSGALHDVLGVLSSGSAELTPSLRGKALMRAARAEYGRRNYAGAKSFFQQHKATGSSNSEDAIWIRKCDDRLKESSTGVYNWARLFLESQREDKLDIGEYTGPIAVKEIPGRGRGIVATKDIVPGELLIVSKAISVVRDQHLSTSILRTALNVRTGQFLTRSQCANIPKLAQIVYGNPDIYAQILHLYAGPDFPLPPATLPPPRGAAAPVEPLRPQVDIDVTRLEEVVMYNSFDFSRVYPTGTDPVELLYPRRAPNAVHLLPSLLNHSCVGNARTRVFSDVLVVRAVARISAGEEVTVPYVAPERPYAERTDALKRFLGDAVCGCRLCDMDRADGEAALRRREEVVASVPDTALFQQPLASLETWETELNATYAPGRGVLRPALTRVVHSVGEKLRKVERTRKQALEANIRGLVGQGFVMTDPQWGPSAVAQLKRKWGDGLPIDVTDLSMCVDEERAVIAMLRIVQYYREENNLVQARRWLWAAQKVESVEFGGDKELFLQKEAAELEGFCLTKFAQNTI